MPSNPAAFAHRGAVMRRRTDFPQWALDITHRRRVLGIYTDYCRRVPHNLIAEKYGISIGQVYVDIKKARVELRLRMSDKLVEATVEAVAKREIIIVEMWATLDALRTLDVSTFRIKTELEILRGIGDQEKAIEELLNLRSRGRAEISDSVIDGDNSNGPPVVIRVDLRTMPGAETELSPSRQPIIDAIPVSSSNGSHTNGFSVPRLSDE